jgi:hypothetical protein
MRGIPAARPSMVVKSTPGGGGTTLPPSITMAIFTIAPTKAPQTVIRMFLSIGFIVIVFGETNNIQFSEKKTVGNFRAFDDKH